MSEGGEMAGREGEWEGEGLKHLETQSGNGRICRMAEAECEQEQERQKSYPSVSQKKKHHVVAVCPFTARII